MLKILSILAFVTFTNLTSITQAGLMLNVGSLTLAPGGSGFVEITISGNGSTDKINLFSLDLSIDPIGNAAGLEFVNPQLTDYVNDNYIFAGISLVPLIDIGTPNNSLTIGDATDPLIDVTVGGPRLLARLQVTTSTLLPPPAVNDQFQIRLVNTFFDSSTAASNIPVTFNSGTVTITAVPEPSSALMMSLASGLAVIFRFGRRKFSQRQNIALQ